MVKIITGHELSFETSSLTSLQNCQNGRNPIVENVGLNGKRVQPQLPHKANSPKRAAGEIIKIELFQDVFC